MPTFKPVPARPSLLHIWSRAVRASSLILILIPVLIGGGLALIDRGFDGWTFLVTMLVAMLMLAGTHLFNDYFDYHKGTDRMTPFPTNAIHMGWLRPRQVYAAGWLCFLLGGLLGSYLVYVGGTPILLLGLGCITAGYLFTGTRLALAYNALGEVAVFLLMGPLAVFGTYYVMIHLFYPHVIFNAIPFGLLSGATLLVSNLRDIEQDKQVGKRTLATLLGRKKARGLFCLLILLAYLILILLYTWNVTPGQALFALLTIPLCYRMIRVVTASDDPMELNVVLGLSMLLQLLFGILNAFGLFLYYFMQV